MSIGSLCFASELRKVKLSDLQWSYDVLTKSWVARDGQTGSTLGYITREMVEQSAFTPLSMLCVWIDDVCRRCIGGPTVPTQHFVARDKK